MQPEEGEDENERSAISDNEATKVRIIILF